MKKSNYPIRVVYMIKQTKGIGEALAEIVLFQSLVRLPHCTQHNPRTLSSPSLLCKTTPCSRLTLFYSGRIIYTVLYENEKNNNN